MKSIKVSFFTALCFGAAIVFGVDSYYQHKHQDIIDLVHKENLIKEYKKGFTEGKTLSIEELINFKQEIIASLDIRYNLFKDQPETYIMTEVLLNRIMKKSNSKLSSETRNQYTKSIIKWANIYELSPIFVAAMIHRETNFREKLISKAKARGPMQVIYTVHKQKLDDLEMVEDDLHDIDKGIHIGCSIIKEYLVNHNYNYRLALYNYVGVVKNYKTGNSYVNDIFNMILYAYDEQNRFPI